MYRARYAVAGKHAAAVHAYLAKRVGLGPLAFRCCGWESKGGQRPFPGGPPNRYTLITMHSEETLLKRRADWPRIGRFYVIVTIVDV